MNDKGENIVLFSKEQPQLKGLIRNAVINTLVFPVWFFFFLSDIIPDIFTHAILLVYLLLAGRSVFLLVKICLQQPEVSTLSKISCILHILCLHLPILYWTYTYLSMN